MRPPSMHKHLLPLLFLFSIFATSCFVRLELGASLWAKSQVLSNCISIALSFCEAVTLFLFLAFLQKISPHRLLTRVVALGLIFAYTIWWAANFFEWEFLGFIRPSSLDTLKFLMPNQVKFIAIPFFDNLNPKHLLLSVLFLLNPALYLWMLRVKEKAYLRTSFWKTGLLFLGCWIAMPILNGKRRYPTYPYLQAVKMEFSGLSWNDIIRSNSFPMPSLFRLYQEWDLPTCTPTPMPTTAAPIQGKLAFINLQLEALNRAATTARFVEQNGAYVMPYFQQLLAESGFESLPYGFHAPGATVHAEFAVLCGLEPNRGFDPFAREKQLSTSCLPRLLHQAGMDTWAAHGNYLSFYNRQAAYPKMGFTSMVSLFDMEKTSIPAQHLGPLDFEAFEFSMDRAMEKGNPFFLHFITLQSHYPFHTHKGTNFTLNQASYPYITQDAASLNRWAQTARELDEDLERMFEFLEKTSQETGYTFLVSAYGDHPPPVPMDFNTSGRLKKRTTEEIQLLYEETPYLAVIFSQGTRQVLPLPHTENLYPYSLSDLPRVLHEQLKNFPAWKELSYVLDDFSVPRKELQKLPFVARGEQVTKILQGQMSTIFVRHPLLEKEKQRMQDAFRCEK